MGSPRRGAGRPGVPWKGQVLTAMGQRFRAVTPHHCLWCRPSQNPGWRRETLTAKHEHNSLLQRTSAHGNAGPARLLSTQRCLQQYSTPAAIAKASLWAKGQQAPDETGCPGFPPKHACTLPPPSCPALQQKETSDYISASSSPAQAPNGGRCPQNLWGTVPSCARAQVCSAPMRNPLEEGMGWDWGVAWAPLGLPPQQDRDFQHCLLSKAPGLLNTSRSRRALEAALWQMHMQISAFGVKDLERK